MYASIRFQFIEDNQPRQRPARNLLIARQILENRSLRILKVWYHIE